MPFVRSDSSDSQAGSGGQAGTLGTAGIGGGTAGWSANLLSVVDATWNNTAWRQDRACADMDPNLFFPIGLMGDAIDQTNLAKSICAQCPVRGQCLEFALRTHQDYGIWGGRTEDERRVMRRNRRAAARRAATAAAQAS